MNVLICDDSGFARKQLMRALPAVPADLTPRRLLHPADNTREDPEAAAAAQRAGSRPIPITRQPRSSNFAAVALPIPALAPVTTAVFCAGAAAV